MEAAKVAEFGQPNVGQAKHHGEQLERVPGDLVMYDKLTLRPVTSSRRGLTSPHPVPLTLLPSKALPQLRGSVPVKPPYESLNRGLPHDLNSRAFVGGGLQSVMVDSQGLSSRDMQGLNGLVISHGKSDSVDSSDGLRRSRLDSHRPPSMGEFFDPTHDNPGDVLPPPPPPRRAYKLVRDGGTSLLVPTSARLLETMRLEALQVSPLVPSHAPLHPQRSYNVQLPSSPYFLRNGGEGYLQRGTSDGPQLPPRSGSIYLSQSTASVYQPEILADYRAKLSSVRATLGDTAPIGGDLRPGSALQLNKWPRGEMERSGSVISVREGESPLNRRASSAAKNALLREKVMGGRKPQSPPTSGASSSPSPVMGTRGSKIALNEPTFYEDERFVRPGESYSAPVGGGNQIVGDAPRRSSKVAALVDGFNAALETRHRHYQTQNQGVQTASPVVTGRSRRSLEELAEQEARATISATRHGRHDREVIISASRQRDYEHEITSGGSRHNDYDHEVTSSGSRQRGYDQVDPSKGTPRRGYDQEVSSSESRQRGYDQEVTSPEIPGCQVRIPYTPPPTAVSGDPLTNLESCQPLNPYILSLAAHETHPPRRAKTPQDPPRARPVSALNPDTRTESSDPRNTNRDHRPRDPPADCNKAVNPTDVLTTEVDADNNDDVPDTGDSGLGSDSASSFTPMVSSNPPTTVEPQQENLGRDSSAISRSLHRGISKAPQNAPVVCRARNELTQGLWDALDGSSVAGGAVDAPLHSFMLPDLSVYEPNFRWFVERDLVEVSTLHALESCGRLNWWWGPCRRLWPLATTGDGNCLLHAASLGMWGFHDRLLSLRSALHAFMTVSPYATALWRRWRYHTARANSDTGLVYSEAEWANEWANVLRLASTAPRNTDPPPPPPTDPPSNTTSSPPEGSPQSPQPPLGGRTSPSSRSGNGEGGGGGAVYESLEEVHIFALAHVLRRPIIVVADTTLKDVHGAPLSPIPFGGVYLPLQHPPSECQACPLLLTYDAAHFSALVAMDEPGDAAPPAVIPLTTRQHALLPLHFAVDPGEAWTPNADPDPPIEPLSYHRKLHLLKSYLHVVEVPISRDFSDYQEFEYEPSAGGSAALSKSSESSGDSDDTSCTCDPPSGGTVDPSSGHLTVPRPCPRHSSKLGTLGRSVSKKFKSLKKMGRPSSFRKKEESDVAKRTRSLRRRASSRRPHGSQNFILGAAIHTEKRMAFQEKMVNNYLANARRRFQELQENKKKNEQETKPSAIDGDSRVPRLDVGPEVPLGEGEEEKSPCVNAGCGKFGSARTSYLCKDCYSKQKDGELALDRGKRSDESPSSSMEETHVSPGEEPPDKPLPRTPARPLSLDGPRHGVGRSRFYANLSPDAAPLPTSRSPSLSQPSALFLSKSTFYNGGNPDPGGPNDKKGPGPAARTLPPAGGNKTRPPKRDQSRRRSNSPSDRTNSNINVALTTTNDNNNYNNNNNNSKKPPRPVDRKARVDLKGAAPPRVCRREGCDFFGNEIFDGFCSQCVALD